MKDSAQPRVPQLSIGMPVFNGENFIREALDALLGQTFGDFELIISDNASTDETSLICQEYAAQDTRIRYIRQTKNLGAVSNFKFVLEQAIGTYFMWAAADDRWDKEWVELLLPISASTNCLAFGTVQTIDCNGNLTFHPANRRNFSYAGNRLLRRLKYYSELDYFGKANPIYGIYPRVFLTNGIFEVLYKQADGLDMLLLYKLLAVCEIKGRTEVVLYKRIHDGCASGESTNYSDKGNYFVRVTKLIKNIVVNQWQRVINFRGQSSDLEKIIHIAICPILVAIDFILLIVRRIKSIRIDLV